MALIPSRLSPKRDCGLLELLSHTKTDADGNATLQSFVSKPIENEIG